MTSDAAFDYARPYDIMVGYWVGTASIYSPKGVYVLSTKSYVSVYWLKPYSKLVFRESAEDEFEFKGPKAGYFDSRRANKKARAKALLGKKALPASDALRVLGYVLDVDGPHCFSDPKARVSVTGRQTRPEAYQFHVKMQTEHGIHHVYNSHHLPTPDDWHIIGPIAGRVGKEEGAIGMAVVQNFRRISYDVPNASVYEFAP
jgi:hypothetical protein